ncbi:hypothetical protein [Sediminibacterium sp.]|uniref:hypothetical protein n=1 Tax=Sediminibacterium sp. TaxID=1917865 RepID=UPI0027278561|nr:hypothetical protein [Sediminibacterium sp.]MDO9000520.1 hypothetical protein [Bacteroidota bacterium]MDP3146912.1 hypothetical protein [Bacteroidota bacterium]MDP3567550.1 hypothetical protein [Sediminibacterium sp.]
MLVRLVGVKLTSLTPGNQQINLFDNTTEQVSLYQTLDKINKRFGNNSVMHCPSLLMHQKQNPKFNKQKTQNKSHGFSVEQLRLSALIGDA